MKKKRRICCINHQFRTSRSIVQDDLEVDCCNSKVDLLKNPFILVELWMSAVGPFSTISSSDCGSLDSVSLVQDSTVSVAMLLLWRSLEFSAECHILRPTMQPSMRRQFSRCACWCGPHVLLCLWLTWKKHFWSHPLRLFVGTIAIVLLCRRPFDGEGPQKMPSNNDECISIILLDTSSDCHSCIMDCRSKNPERWCICAHGHRCCPVDFVGAFQPGKFHRGYKTSWETPRPGDESMTRRGLLGAALPAVVPVVGWAAEMIFFRWKTRPWCFFSHISTEMFHAKNPLGKECNPIWRAHIFRWWVVEPEKVGKKTLFFYDLRWPWSSFCYDTGYHGCRWVHEQAIFSLWKGFVGFYGMGSFHFQAQEGAGSLHEAGTVLKLAFFVVCSFLLGFGMVQFQCAHVCQGIDYLESHEIDERFAQMV